MRILYLGLPLGALCLKRAGHAPLAIGLSYPRWPGGRRVRRTLGRGGALVLGWPALEDPEVIRTIASMQPEALLCWFWPRRVPPSVLALAPRGAFNVHPSLLPRWRGPDPTFWAVRAGDAVTGVTLHRMAAEYDAGPIVAQREVAIAATDDAWSLADRLARPGLALLVECAERLARGERLDGSAQDEAQATWAPRPTEDELWVDWRARAGEVLALVRACGRRRGAHAVIGAHDVEIVQAAAWSGELPKALAPAEALLVGEGLAVRCGDSAVLVSEVRDADGVSHEGAALHALAHTNEPQ
jgi:methionyl-tRNA formyltransferase